MKSWRWTVCIFVAASSSAAGIASCGSDGSTVGAVPAADGGSGNDGGSDALVAAGEAGTTIDPSVQASIAQDLAAARCDQALTCAGRALVSEGPHDHYPFRFNFDARKVSPDECNAETSARLRNTFAANVVAAAAGGALAYHPEKLPACLAAIRGNCDTDTFLPPPCNEAFEGKVPLNGACATDAVCAAGTVCEFGDDKRCGGRCITPKKATETCYNGSGCEEGLFCPPSGGVCTLRPKHGESCTQITNGTLPPCNGFLLCIGASSNTTCQSLAEVATGAIGTACLDSTGPLCIPPLLCAMQLTNPDAGPSSGNSCRGEYPAGGACSFSYPDLCPDTHYCEAQTGTGGTCNPRRAAGATCTEQQACARGTRCSGSASGVCMPVKDNGEACTSSTTCWSGACTKGKCTVSQCG
jgi:hypothetical protein